MGKLNCSSHSLGTGGWTSVVCNVAGKPLAAMKCFSGTKRPERLLKVHCGGCFNFSMACSISTALGGGAAGLGEGGACKPRLSANCQAFFVMSSPEKKRNAAATKTASRS